MRLLMVLTSHEQLGNTGKKTGVWLEEFTAPYYVFTDEDVDIDLASPKGGEPPIDPRSEEPNAQTAATKRFQVDASAQYLFANTLKLSTVSARDYDAVFYPGGHGPLWDLAEDQDSIALIESLIAEGKVIGAVCHGPAAFRHAKTPRGEHIVKDKSVTGFSNAEEEAAGLIDVVPFLVEDMLKQNGGRYSKAGNWEPHAVVDGALVTGQNPASSTGTAWLLLDKLLGNILTEDERAKASGVAA
jgi:putative intracellular protease/amidase